MTPDELEVLRLRMQFEALRVLIRGMFVSMSKASPSAAQALREKFAALRSEHAQIVIKGASAEYSDLIAAEYQSALDDLLAFIESGVNAP
jgi:3-oxoacyl-(acyl-carrier-protein) synthase